MNATSTAPAAVAAADALQHDPEVAALIDRERVRQVEGAEPSPLRTTPVKPSWPHRGAFDQQVRRGSAPQALLRRM